MQEKVKGLTTLQAVKVKTEVCSLQGDPKKIFFSLKILQ